MEIDLTVHWLKTIANLELPEERIVEGDREILVRYTPLGVTVGIVPWNYPILLAASKIAPCVVTGNPIIIKPSPFTPAGDLKLVELAQRFFLQASCSVSLAMITSGHGLPHIQAPRRSALRGPHSQVRRSWNRLPRL